MRIKIDPELCTYGFTKKQLSEARVLLQAYVKEARESSLPMNKVRPNAFESARPMLNASKDEQVLFALAAKWTYRFGSQDNRTKAGWALGGLVDQMLRRALPYQAEHIRLIATILEREAGLEYGPDVCLIGAIERYLKKEPLPPEAVPALEAAVENTREAHHRGDPRKAATRIAKLLKAV